MEKDADLETIIREQLGDEVWEQTQQQGEIAEINYTALVDEVIQKNPKIV